MLLVDITAYYYKHRAKLQVDPKQSFHAFNNADRQALTNVLYEIVASQPASPPAASHAISHPAS